jgi:hypothetical protein
MIPTVMHVTARAMHNPGHKPTTSCRGFAVNATDVKGIASKQLYNFGTYDGRILRIRPWKSSRCFSRVVV